MRLPAVIIAVAAILAVGCTKDAAVPRQLAFPRLETYDTTYIETVGATMPLSVNASAQTEIRDGGRWVDVYYPLYHGKLSLTIIGDSVMSALDNRIERMGRNLGDFYAEQTDVNTPDCVTGIMLTTTAECVTPVQFVATDRRRFVVSGSFSFDSAIEKAKADSVAPLVTAVAEDVIHLIKSLK